MNIFAILILMIGSKDITRGGKLDMQKGDLVIIIKRNRKGDDRFEAVINWTEERTEGYVYFGYTATDTDHGLFGCARYYGEFARPFGVVSIKVIGHRDITPKPPYMPNLKGNPGFDPLM